MSMNFIELNDVRVRELMLEEFVYSKERNEVYLSNDFVAGVQDQYFTLIERAISKYDEEWLKNYLISGFFMEQNVKSGRAINKRHSAERLAQTEFNRFYTRGICRKALERGDENVEVYRARNSQSPDPKSQAQIGHQVKASQLLEELRNKPVFEIDFPRVSSGLSVKTINQV